MTMNYIIAGVLFAVAVLVCGRLLDWIAERAASDNDPDQEQP